MYLDRHYYYDIKVYLDGVNGCILDFIQQSLDEIIFIEYI